MSAVRYELDRGIAVVTIDRPEARNAVDDEVARGIEAALDRAEGPDAARVVILTGTPPVYCAGADLKMVGAGRARELVTDRGGFAGVVRRERTVPLIAAVDGPALAGGTEIVLACDLVVASTAARFGIPEVKRGLVAGAGGLFRLPRKLPLVIAMEAALTGDPISVEDAHRHGLVNVLCEPGQALGAARELAERIAVNAPNAVAVSRQVMLDTAFAADDIAWEHTMEANWAAIASDEAAEGVRAFVEKRPPAFAVR
jgi:enoyl-CoA hydratase